MLGLSFALIFTEPVQTWLVKRVSAYLSDELKTTVKVERVNIRFFKSVVLEGLYVQDLKGDTLLYCKEFVAAINTISVSQRKLDLGKIALNKGKFNLIRHSGEKHDNLHFLTEYFSSSDTIQKSPSRPWQIKLKSLALEDMTFRRDIDDEPHLETGVDFSHLNLTQINGELEDYHTKGDTFFVNLNKIRFNEQSGFTINDLSAKASLTEKHINLEKLQIHSPNTNIEADLKFAFESFDDFDYFIEKVRWNGSLRKGVISFKDISYFTSDLWGMKEFVELTGDFKGTVDRFKGKNVVLRWSNNTSFRGNIAMTGLPDIEETYIELFSEEFVTTVKDVEKIPLPPFTNGGAIKVPENLSDLGTVVFKGRFTGFPYDFVAYGGINTDIGSLNCDLNLKYDENIPHSYYSGHLSANNFDVGKVLLYSDLGRITFNSDVKGSGLKLDNVNAKFKGKIEALQFKRYEYHGITAEGELAKKLFTGNVKVSDPNADMDFIGTIDMRKALPEFNFTADIRNADLDTLNLFSVKAENKLQTKISTHFIGNRPDNIEGSIAVDGLNFYTGTKLYHINQINLFSERSSGKRNVDITSDILDANFNGSFEVATLSDAFKEIIPRYLPSYIVPKKQFVSKQDFSYDIRLKNLNLISELFLPSWDFSPETSINGHFNSYDYDLTLNVKSDYIKYLKYSLNDFQVEVKADQSQARLSASSLRITDSDKPLIELPSLTALAENDQLQYVLKLADNDSFPNRAHLEGRLDFYANNVLKMKIDSSLITVDRLNWLLDPNNEIVFDTSGIEFKNMFFSRSNEQINLSGKIQAKIDNRLAIQVQNFHLNNLNTLLKGSGTRIGGVVNGSFALSGTNNSSIQVESDLHVNALSLNEDTLGNADLRTIYNDETKTINANVSIIKGIAKIVDINGNYYLTKKDDNFDFNIRINNFYLHTLERYMDDIVKDVHGKVSAELTLHGTPDKPVFTGNISLNKTSLIVTYLNTRYSFSTNVKVEENNFILPSVTLVDENNNEATAEGNVYHEYFGKFGLAVSLQAKKFEVLNTTLKDNSLYYGKAYATGSAHFYGPLENIVMDISLSPDKNTVLNIPLNTTSDISKSEFISFITRSGKDSSGEEITRNKVNLSGVKLNMNLDMNQNALFNIIFDEKIGDVISGTGTGSLRLDINTAGEFNMYGTYLIDKGDYLFTLQNLINKKFTVEKGGTITWAGDPYNAIVDLSAVYVVYTSSLYNLVQDSTYKRRIPVDTRLFLKNKLMNPTITYEIEVRGLDPTSESVVKTYLNSEQEINRQMFGLLVFNQFVPQSSGQASGKLSASAATQASASELLSNQVSNWLSQISKDVNIGFNYRAKDTYSNEEVQLMFSKTLFNDRLTVEGNVGYMSTQATVNSTVVGDFNAEYKVSEDGKFRLRGFNRSNADNIIKYSQSPYSQGFGVFYRQDFDNFKDLMIRLRLKKAPPADS